MPVTLNHGTLLKAAKKKAEQICDWVVWRAPGPGKMHAAMPQGLRLGGSNLQKGCSKRACKRATTERLGRVA